MRANGALYRSLDDVAKICSVIIQNRAAHAHVTLQSAGELSRSIANLLLRFFLPAILTLDCTITRRSQCSMISVQFLITSLIVVLIPGTGVVYTISTGLTQGKRASVFASFGCTLGIVPHLLATILGLSAVMHTSALAFQTLKYLGVAYLFYIKDRRGLPTLGGR